MGSSLHNQFLPSSITSNKFIFKKPIIRLIIQNMLSKRDSMFKTKKHPLYPLIGNSLEGIMPINRLSVDLSGKMKKKLKYNTLFKTYNNKMHTEPWIKKRVVTSGTLIRSRLPPKISLKCKGYSCWESEKEEEASFSNGILNVN